MNLTAAIDHAIVLCAKLEAEIAPRFAPQPYQAAMLRMMATVPDGYQIKTIMQGGRAYHFATKDEFMLAYRWDGKTWIEC